MWGGTGVFRALKRAVGLASACSLTNSLIRHAWMICLLPEDDRINQIGVPDDFRSVLAALVFLGTPATVEM